MEVPVQRGILGESDALNSEEASGMNLRGDHYLGGRTYNSLNGLSYELVGTSQSFWPRYSFIINSVSELLFWDLGCGWKSPQLQFPMMG